MPVSLPYGFIVNNLPAQNVLNVVTNQINCNYEKKEYRHTHTRNR